MSVSLWVIYIIFAFILGAFAAVIWGNKRKKNDYVQGYAEGYSKGYKNGSTDQYNRDFNTRLLKQSRRAARKNQCITSDIEQSGVIPEEKKNEQQTADSETGVRAVQGSTESSDSESVGGESSLFLNDAAAGAGTEPSHE